MTYPDAYDGVKKIFTAQILALIGTGCTVFGALIGGVGLVFGSLASGIGGGVIVVASFVLAILALVLTLIGLNRASRDEEIFRKAFIWSLVSLIVSVIGDLLSLFGVGGSVLENVFDLLTLIFGIVVIAYIFKGIESLAYRLARNDVATSGHNVLVLLYIAYGVTIFCRLMALISLSSPGVLSILGIISLLAGIAMIVGYILYLVHLNKAKNMLTA